MCHVFCNFFESEIVFPNWKIEKVTLMKRELIQTYFKPEF